MRTLTAGSSSNLSQDQGWRSLLSCIPAFVEGDGLSGQRADVQKVTVPRAPASLPRSAFALAGYPPRTKSFCCVKIRSRSVHNDDDD
jgi:hypothetical protein